MALEPCQVGICPWVITQGDMDTILTVHSEVPTVRMEVLTVRMVVLMVLCTIHIMVAVIHLIVHGEIHIDMEILIHITGIIMAGDPDTIHTMEIYLTSEMLSTPKERQGVATPGQMAMI